MRQVTVLWICIFSFATKGLSLVCESYDQKCRTSNSAASGNSSCSILQQCDHILGSTPACYALFGQNKDGGLNTIMKGCITQPAQDCAPSSVCNGQRKSLHNSPALYHCCCTEDKCNRDVIILISEETEKNCVVKDIKESIRQLTLLIWGHLVAMTIVLSVIAIILMLWKLISYKRRKKISRHVKHLSQVVCDKGVSGTHQYQNTSRWKKQDFQLITCLVRSTFGEIWQARLHGSNRIVRIRLSVGSDDVYVYDKQLMAKNTNVNTARVV
ncbi:uncharacterized protein LOC110065489 isoform X2 [Orbicella faveolata]|uniref:uncharacterized protein LOC110065489 isoform X1 n=1 Tax=Orbicella faveolata TaxID=48498 RepID=UPI0009E58509|nr:uncharacterized protein LOC110065489 isoform X1 [Orbicella faveolata]XP_020628300.1 uncharacterized protein LOC110065489 isoform X1 [Orbicella faveolata]XP_020628301.1 uncharacterized protein LOC110065489 isoform X1 [Orbicella faveolata]XP_020628302.1 uncharacterized protein LOC110065489 isoform X2 [Orbicella faveolata]